MRELIVQLMATIVAIIFALISKNLIPAIKAAIEDNKYHLIIVYVMEVVKAMQQTLEGNEEKKAEAVKRVKSFLEKKGYDLTDEEIDTLIEAAVKQLKIEEK